ncbi:hypothetical protein [Pleomorphomonas oryzae]|uniref:hypothetical protein n=1 Tax=Pleomorphomonas oryzae TaxID=261934 RepID=UPI000478F33E|nr:hypothetical protein [Pleomorphomonas oryzae]
MIEEILTKSLSDLYAEEGMLFKLDVAERTICARFAAILQRYFTNHSVHAEYNRHGVYPKEIDMPNADGVLTSSLVSPDIIVHLPGHDQANILVIEAKKTSNPMSDLADLSKLERIKHQIGYQHAVFLRLPIGDDALAENVQISWVS